MSIHNFSGIWKLNPVRSNIPPVTKSQVLTIETDGVNISMQEDLVNEKDEHLFISVRGRLDGNDNPVTGTPFADTVAYRMLDNHTIEGIAKKNGLICVKETAVLSEDGATVHVTYETFDNNGNVHLFYGIFDRIDSSSKVIEMMRQK